MDRCQMYIGTSMLQILHYLNLLLFKRPKKKMQIFAVVTFNDCFTDIFTSLLSSVSLPAGIELRKNI